MVALAGIKEISPQGKGRFFFPTVEERASHKDSVDRENACSDACMGESSSASLKVSFTKGRKDPYDHIGSIAEKVFLSWTRSQRTTIFLLRTQRLTKKMGNHPHKDQKTHSNALKSPKDLFRSSGSDLIRNRRIGTRGTK
ncbi:hypothetical protein ACOSQ3_028791 [Xanthoceras sorbifolium]